MDKIKISAVSYTNTKPFIYGIEKSEVRHQIDLSLDIPSDCAAKLINNQVDIGLIPVAAIPSVPNANIIGSYCIGSVGAVNSVFIFSKVPASEIKTLKLDPQSRTSNNLAKVLLKFHFKVSVELITDPDIETDALVLIGDRTFGRKGDFAYAYDMGEEWMKLTGLPFVYAAWVANKMIPEQFIAEFNEALKLGLAHRKELLKELPTNSAIDLEDYLLHKLDFDLTDDKRKALDLFLNYIKQL
ncbi:menaquinone biosynthetic enzyme MqnA/MqnD family protein [Pedobacter sp. Hv1]|uniref:menaquinone biosynthetic enzyme MqnA/MqnD family protein n=1 Tax=Pedobacter sp. Hv1 TaxID=1740090 RepID=UPI0006D8B273|nr:menaquinone biosynthesis protein [Pedobacter sp. Hv1]KQC01064.1 radical SAM protein [Pedobacter sp. Hv1]